MRATRQIFLAACCLLAACRATDEMGVTLTRGEGRFPVAAEEVQVQFENPPGGTLVRRTDARGRLTLPRRYEGLRARVATECEGPGRCRRVSPPHRLEGAEATWDISGGLGYP